MKDLLEGVNLAIALPTYIQVALPAGYLGYMLSRCGISHHDRPITILFLSSCYALISLLAWKFVSESYVAIQFGFAICTPIILALFWRKYLHKWVMHSLHHFRICNSSQFPSLWSEITQNTAVGMTQATVYLKSGLALSCHYFYDFDDAPLNLFRSDRDGNIALYVTHEKPIGETLFNEIELPNLNVRGTIHYRLTYVPKAEIERIEFLTNHPISLVAAS